MGGGDPDSCLNKHLRGAGELKKRMCDVDVEGSCVTLIVSPSLGGLGPCTPVQFLPSFKLAVRAAHASCV